MIRLIIKIVFLGICISCCSNAFSQEWIDEDENEYRPKFALKFSPFAFLSTTGAIQFSGEVKTFVNQSFQLEYGYVNEFYFHTEDFNGFKLKSEYRFYNPFKNLRPINSNRIRSKNFFIGVQYFRKRVDARGNGTVSRGNANYQEVLPLSVKNITDSFFLVFGKVNQFKGRFYREIAFGVGAKNIRATVYGIPEDGTLITGFSGGGIWDLADGQDAIGFLDMFISFKLIYAFE